MERELAWDGVGVFPKRQEQKRGVCVYEGGWLSERTLWLAVIGSAQHVGVQEDRAWCYRP